MSTTTQTDATRFMEEPTNNLRQVRYVEWVQDHLIVYYKTQREWRITPFNPHGDVIRVWSQPNLEGVPDKKAMKLEWRDLPEVNSEDIK